MLDPTTPGVPVTPVSPNVTPEPRGYLSTEPVKAATRATQLVAFLVAVAAFFGLPLTTEQQTSLAIMAPFILFAIGFLGDWLRAAVVPVQRAQALIDRAYVAATEAGEVNKPTLPA